MSALDQMKALWADEKGQMRAGRVAISLIISLVVAGLVAAFLLPVAIDEIVAVDTTNWSSGAQSLWGILDLIIVLGVFLFMLGVSLAATDRV